MKMAPGRAFLLGSDPQEGGVLVSKSWVQLQGRQFLVEEVPVEALANQLAQLPVAQAASAKPNVNSALHVVSAKRMLPAPRLTKTSPSGKFKQVAQIATPSRGLVLDYVTINGSQTNYTFQGDTTYYISGALNLYRTNTFEGGAVLKFATNSSITIPSGPLRKSSGTAGLIVRSCSPPKMTMRSGKVSARDAIGLLRQPDVVARQLLSDAAPYRPACRLRPDCH